VAAGSALAGQALALLGLGLRLRSQARRDREHRRFVAGLTQSLPPGSHLHGWRDDGANLTVVVAPGRDD
jgi:hypothetical protein